MNAPLPKTVDILGQKIDRVEYLGNPVITYAKIDFVHKRPEGTAKDAFARNKNRFVKGRDYNDVTRKVWPTDIPWPFEKNAPTVRVFTKRGYLLITKPLTDDLAWEVQGEMVDRYFIVEEALASLDANGQHELNLDVSDGMQAFRSEINRNGSIVTRSIDSVKLTLLGYLSKNIASGIHHLQDSLSDLYQRTGKGLNTVNNNVKAVHGQLADLNAKFSPANGDRPIIMSDWYGCSRIYRDLYGVEKMPRQGMLSAAVARSLDAFVLRSRQNFNMTMIETNTAPSRAWHIDAVRPWFDQIGKRMIDQHVSNYSAPLFERKQS